MPKELKYPDYAKYQKHYRDSHPEKILAQRTRYYINFLRKAGYLVIAPEDQQEQGGNKE